MGRRRERRRRVGQTEAKLAMARILITRIFPWKPPSLGGGGNGMVPKRVGRLAARADRQERREYDRAEARAGRG
jgi:hypothetical protein